MQRKPKLGDERYLIEILSAAAVEALARKQGWAGGDEGIREFCEPEDAAVYWIRRSLDEAKKAAADWLSNTASFYGCVIIDRQVFEEARDDRGNLIMGVPPVWERQESYELAMDGETITIDR